MEQPSSKALFTPAKTQRASEAIYNQIYLTAFNPSIM